jgi:hypothetical protein
MMRTRRKQITFEAPFHLRVCDGVFPAGTYEVDTDEELIDGMSFVAYRRTATRIRLPAIGTKTMCHEVMMVQPSELEAGVETFDKPPRR